MHLSPPPAAAAMAAILGLALLAGTGPASAAPSSQRPGPDLLYAPPADAPQLQNTGVWHADPILVSGAQKYDSGEFLYQDYLYDDHGAYGTADTTDPFAGSMFSPKRGTLTYPTDQGKYANNAADLVELRVKPLADATAFRVTLNTMIDSSKSAFTIALGDSAQPVAWPYGAGVKSRANLFLTVHGNIGTLVDVSGAALSPAPSVTVDTNRRQITVTIPRTAWDPGSGTVRMSAGTGLWDTTAGSYLIPGATATASTPGGAAGNKAALFNLAFRTAEPKPDLSAGYFNNSNVDGPAVAATGAQFWRERGQADVLKSGDISSLSANVDFGKLAAGTTDASGVPVTGDINRILASHSDLGQGVDYSHDCAPWGTVYTIYNTPVVECTGRLVGQLQPYAIYVPDTAPADSGYGMVMALHSLSANYNQYQSLKMTRQFAVRSGKASLVVSPAGRGPDAYWRSYAEADLFEVWADVARRYPLDSSRTQLFGYSMGGTGTYRVAARWPDLFARALPVVGAFPVTIDTFRSLRNVPVQAWTVDGDETIPASIKDAPYYNAANAGIRYDEKTYAYSQHLTLANNDEYGPAADFLGDTRVVTNPAHVSYYADPAQDTTALSKADHAYWVSKIKLTSPNVAGRVEVRTRAFGYSDPAVLAPVATTGVLTGGTHGSLGFYRRTLGWSAPPPEAVTNVVDVWTTNVNEITIDAARAGLTCNPWINILGAPVIVHIAC